MSAKPISSMTEDELLSAFRTAIRLEFAAIGLHLESHEDQEKVREDMRLIRKIREGKDGIAGKVGGALILAMVSGLLWLLWVGFQAIAGKVP